MTKRSWLMTMWSILLSKRDKMMMRKRSKLMTQRTTFKESKEKLDVKIISDDFLEGEGQELLKVAQQPISQVQEGSRRVRREVEQQLLKEVKSRKEVEQKLEEGELKRQELEQQMRFQEQAL